MNVNSSTASGSKAQSSVAPAPAIPVGYANAIPVLAPVAYAHQPQQQSSNPKTAPVATVKATAGIPVAPTPYQLAQASHLLNPLLKGAAGITMPAAFPIRTHPLGLIQAQPTAYLPLPQTVRPRTELRSGKWIPEEEEYALLLIELFEKGLILDCENGATLRSYLAPKLHCAPMRISKKFAGKGIGKMVYQAATNQVPGPELAQKIKKTEELYRKAINPTIHSTIPYIHTPSIQAGFVAAAPAMSAKPYSVSIPTSTTLSVSTQITGEQAKQLQTSYYQALAAAAPVAHPSTMTAPQPQATVIHQAVHAVAPSPMVAAPALYIAPTPALHVSAPATLAAAATRQPVVDAPNPVYSACAPSPLPTTSAPSVQTKQPVPPAQQQQELPDLLSGFDKVVKSMKADSPAPSPAAPSPSPAPLDHSPPFTSQSFDDFHRFLGKDLVLNDTATPAEEMNALFTAESYAMFAQESAAEASQHAAYIHPKEETDVDGMLRLVESHHHDVAVVSEPNSGADDDDTASYGHHKRKKPKVSVR